MKNNIDTAVILAAGMGTRLRSVTNNMIPKGFLEVEGLSLIERSIEKLRNNGIKKIYIVTGHLNSFYDELASNDENIFTLKNEHYEFTGSMASLAVLENVVNEDFLLLESDIIYEEKALQEALNYPADDCIMISGRTNSGDEYYVEVRDNNLYKASKNKDEIDEIYGEWVGVCKISLELFKCMLSKYKASDMEQYHYEYSILDSAQVRSVGYLKVDDLIWAEIDDASHLERVKNIILPKLYEKGEK